MYVLSKLLGFVTKPLCGVLLLLFAGVVCLRKRPQWGQRLCASALALLLVSGWMLPPTLLAHWLEASYPEMAPNADLHAYAGAIILGGATESGELQQAHVQPLLNEHAERMTTPVALLRGNPHLRLIYTGGEGNLLGSGPSEAERALVFFDTMGVPAQQIQYESASRNTYENAILSAKLPGIEPQQPWLLVTSALHMPRSMAVFRHAGWNVTPYPVDYITTDTPKWTGYSIDNGPSRWDAVLHELLGIAVYRVTGKL